VDTASVSPLVIGIIGAVVLLFLVAALIVRRVKVAGPNQAYIITGRKGRPVHNPETGEVSTDMSGQKVVMGASVFVLPFVQKLHIMELSSRRISVGIRGAVSAQGIKCDLDGVALVKVGGNEDAIRAASQRFLDQQDGIEAFTQEVLAGSLRAIVGRLTVDEIIKDRAAFASAVAEEAETSLTNQGLSLDTFQLQDIQTEGSYLQDLGRPEAARVQMEAAIAEAKAKESSEREQLLADEAIAVAQRQFELKQSEIKAEVDAAAAEANAAGPLSQAAQDQNVITQQEKVAERNAALKDRQLDTEIRKPADAQRYRVEQEAQGRKNSEIAEAQAEAERDRLRGEGQLAQRRSLAEAVQAEGEAEAAALLAKGEAEAGAREKNAEAFSQYGEAAILELVVHMLPDLVKAASEPISGIEKLTVISTDGASDLTKNVASNLETGLQIGSDVTGVDLRSLFGNVVKRDRPTTPTAAVKPDANTPAKATTPQDKPEPKSDTPETEQ
jgi:flotillin